MLPAATFAEPLFAPSPVSLQADRERTQSSNLFIWTCIIYTRNHKCSRLSLHGKCEGFGARPTCAGTMGGTDCDGMTRSPVGVRRILLLAIGFCIFPQHSLHCFNGFWGCAQALIQSCILLEDVDGIASRLWWWWVARVIEQWLWWPIARVVNQWRWRLVAGAIHQCWRWRHERLSAFAELAGFAHPI